MNKRSERLVTLLDVYVDEFITMSYDIRHSHLEKLSRAMLHGIHAILPPPEVTGHNGFVPVSEKQMGDGDGIWDLYKKIRYLGLIQENPGLELGQNTIHHPNPTK